VIAFFYFYFLCGLQDVIIGTVEIRNLSAAISASVTSGEIRNSTGHKRQMLSVVSTQDSPGRHAHWPVSTQVNEGSRAHETECHKSVHRNLHLALTRPPKNTHNTHTHTHTHVKSTSCVCACVRERVCVCVCL
jgi:hypothetical protein